MGLGWKEWQGGRMRERRGDGGILRPAVGPTPDRSDWARREAGIRNPQPKHLPEPDYTPLTVNSKKLPQEPQSLQTITLGATSGPNASAKGHLAHGRRCQPSQAEVRALREGLVWV